MMADPRLQGLNYSTPLTIDDLDHLEKVYADEFVRRIRGLVGSYRAEGPSFGVLSETDPDQAASITDPLFVKRDEIDGMTVDVYPGTALVENGMLAILTQKVEQLVMVNQEVGQQNVVFIEYVLVDDQDTIVRTRFDSSEARRIIRGPDTESNPLALRTLQVAKMEDWQNNTLFPPDRRKNVVALALITIVSTTDTPFKQVSVDLTRNNLTTNRPWYSPVDIAHRSQVGTGASTVPHRLGLNDLSQGDLTLYEQLLNHGMVIGRDYDVPGVPGALCLETITPARVLIDTDGSVTGALSQRYVELTRYPIRLLGAYALSDPTDEVMVGLIPHTNVLTIHHDEFVPTNGFRLQYSTVEAGEPLPNSLINDEIHVRQPVPSRELLISGGSGFSEIAPKFTDAFNNSRARVSLGTSGAIPKRYRILVDNDGQLLFTPQHILCATKLDDIGLAVFEIETAMLGNARIRVGLQGVALNAATMVRLRLTGSDNLGATVTEDVQFDYATYDSPVVGDCEENPRNFQVSSTVFRALDSITVLERTADGPATAVCVYADLDPTQTDAIRDACPLVEAFWDGEGVCRIHDIRQVYSRLEQPTRTTPIKIVGQGLLAMFAAQGSADAMELLSEDLRDPHWLKLNDPIRFYKLADGLQSSILPDQPGVESSGQGTEQNIYTSQALRLHPGVDRNIHVALLGVDAQRYWVNSFDGIQPRLEYRWSLSASPDQWIDWTDVTALPSANGSNFTIAAIDDDAFTIQLRVKGSIAGVVALQYRQLEGSQVFSGIRNLDNVTMTLDTLNIITLPFGQSFPTTIYQILVKGYLDPSETDTDFLFRIVRVEKFVDHAKIHLYPSVSLSNRDVEFHWTVDLQPNIANSDGGFGDTIA